MSSRAGLALADRDSQVSFSAVGPAILDQRTKGFVNLLSNLVYAHIHTQDPMMLASQRTGLEVSVLFLFIGTSAFDSSTIMRISPHCISFSEVLMVQVCPSYNKSTLPKEPALKAVVSCEYLVIKTEA